MPQCVGDPAPFQGDRAGGDPGIERRGHPRRRLQVVGDAGRVARTHLAAVGPREPGRERGVTCRGRPFRTAGAAELVGGPAGLVECSGVIAAQQGGSGQEQPDLGDDREPPVVFELPHSLGRDLARLREQLHGQEQFAAVAQDLAQLGALGAQPLLGLLQVRQRARQVTAQRVDPAQVLQRERRGHAHVELVGHPARLQQIGQSVRQFEPVAVQDATVGEHPPHPHAVAGAPQQRQGLVVGRERVVEATGLVQEHAPLGQPAEAFRAAQIG
jgi:hypothetical protein